MVTLGFFDPGHFHAALTLKSPNPRINPVVHLYAAPGADREAFLSLVTAFNSRDEAPTRWQVEVHEADDPLSALVDEGRVDAVVLAGRNQHKLATIATLHAAGIAVLADKPWLTTPEALAHLDAVTARGPLVMDIMTSRFDPTAQLRRVVANTSAVFGDFISAEAGVGVELGSRHHLHKLVNGAPLIRPEWYFDRNVQGDGLVDIQSHMIDQAQWLLDSEVSWKPDTSSLLGVEAWPTPVDAALYHDITGATPFPAMPAGDVVGDVLHYACNGQINFTIHGVQVQTRAEWGGKEPAGGGDLHHSITRGTHAEVHMRHGPQTNFFPELHLCGANTEAVDASWSDWVEAFPGLTREPSDIGVRLILPQSLRSTHESHFGMVLNDFLDLLEAGTWSASLAAQIRARYTLIAMAKSRAEA